MEKYVVYILECNDGTYYTGITNNLKRRLQQHQKGIASKYTRSRLPVVLRYVETAENRSEALKREYEVKRLRRSAKERLISKMELERMNQIVGSEKL